VIVFNKQLLLVRNPKTAGISLVRYLGDCLSGVVHRAGVKELGTHHPSLSLALGYACAVTQNRPEDFRRIISAIRDPFDRETSMYLYFRNVLCKSPAASEHLNDANIERAVRMAGQLNFASYLSWVWGEFGTCDIWRSYCYYRTSEGFIPRNLFVVRTEKIEADLAVALEAVDLKLRAESVPRLNVSDRSGVDVRFTDHTRQLVISSYRWMFDDGFYS
jgi:hypothetical protein